MPILKGWGDPAARGQVHRIRGHMVVTPDGSIIDIRNVGRRRKPETDPDWEEREAERKATKARRLCGSD